MNKNDKYLRLIVLLLCGLFLLSGHAFAADKVLDVSQRDRDAVPLTEYISVLEDPTQSLTLADVRKPDMASHFVPTEALNYGQTRSAYWLRLNLRNASDQPVERMLEIAYAVLTDVSIHQPLVDGAYQSVMTGAGAPFSTRPYPNRFFVFPLMLQAHSEQVIYLRIRTEGSLLVPAKLWEPHAFHTYERDDYAVQVWYFGVASAMMLFNLLLFIALRDSVYLLYDGFVLFTALSVLAVSGLGKEFLWPNATLWSVMSDHIFYVCMSVTLLLFMRRILNTRDIVPRLDRMIKILGSLYLPLLIGIVVSMQTFALPTRLYMVAMGPLILWIGVYCAVFKRQRIAVIFVAAYFMYMVGPIFITLKLFKLLPVNFFTTNGILVGSAFEMLLMAFALAYRFNMIRRKATEDVKQANAGLEQRVRSREAELTQSHQRLREIELRQTLSEERQRLMQDMHDGLGSSLTSALRVVEHGRMDEAEVAQMLKGCIDDLKLAIDSMEPVEADLLLLLATLRFRLGPRLESTGIALRWEVQNLQALDWLDPKNSLHILRILQEAFTNIIKHTKATEIRVATGADADGVMVTITDNGPGFSVENALKSGGKGLSNQLRRAQSIGAEVKWDSNDSGTCLTLRLPIKRYASHL
ncbi:MAG: sensor domain-containing diguanylate cyclase [Rhodoferax sp.]|nr:sensor domain-containing diguanylate cyclase [Rhodoferax sp.]